MRLISICLVLLLAGVSSAFAQGVGFTRIKIGDPMGGQMQVSIWYPFEGESGVTRLGPFELPATRNAPIKPGRHGLVAISHGTGGSDLGHRNIAVALAEAGYIAAAVLHPRNNFRDNQGEIARVVMEGRPLQLRAVIDALLSLEPWSAHVDEKQIGAFGFSYGGYTVLSALGAKPLLKNVVSHCEKGTGDPFCKIGGDLGAALKRRLKRDYKAPFKDLSDPRVCAAVIADPSAVMFSEDSVKAISAKHIQMWRPQIENILLADAHASRIVRLLNERPGQQAVEEIVVPNAQHYSFLPPFPTAIAPALPAELVKDAPGFDRTEFHKRFAADVTAFLRKSLQKCKTAG